MIYVIYGNDQELLINSNIDKCLKDSMKNITDFNVSNYDYSNSNIEEIVDDCDTIPFIEENKGIIVKNCSFLNKEEEINPLIDYLNHPSNTTNLILVYEGNINEKLEVVKILKEKARIIKINEIKDSDWGQFISQLIIKKNIEISDDAKEEFINRVKGDLTKTVAELEKLKNLSCPINKEIITSLVSRPLEENMFGMVDAILENKIDKALQIYKDLKLQGLEPIAFIITLSKQFRFIYQCSFLHDNGYSNDDIANELNVKSGRVYYSLKKMGSYTRKDILNILDRLFYWDNLIRTGEVDGDRGFELFLIGDKSDEQM